MDKLHGFIRERDIAVNKYEIGALKASLNKRETEYLKFPLQVARLY